MDIELVVVGKTDMWEVDSLVEMYSKRINFYTRFSVCYLPDLKNTKNLSEAEQKSREGEMILKKVQPSDLLVLMDEHGKEYRSLEYAAWLQKQMASGARHMVMVIGGPYGFSEEVYKRANSMISLSKMTFSHQIVRAIFTEQLYRAFTILRNEPYHHE